MCVAGVWNAYKFYLNPRSKEKNIGIRVFANLLAEEMLHNKEPNLAPEDVANTLPFLGLIPGDDNDLDGGLDLLLGDSRSSSSRHHSDQDIDMVAVTRQGSAVSSMADDMPEHTQMMSMGVIEEIMNVHELAENGAKYVIEGGGATCPGSTEKNASYFCALNTQKKRRI